MAAAPITVRLVPNSLHRAGNEEQRQRDAERLHRGIVADHIRADAARLHDQRQQREHQSQREAENRDGGDGRNEIDETLAVHDGSGRFCHTSAL
jgi:hypothetical protein